MKKAILILLLLLLSACTANHGVSVSRIIEKDCPVCVAQEVQCQMPEAQIIKQECGYDECYSMLKEAKQFQENIGGLK